MVKRDSYLKRLIHNMWNGEVKVITGIRRCGKSVMLFDLFHEYLLSQGVPEDHILKFELDQRRYYKYRNPITLCEYVEDAICDKKEEKFYLFIDEVQKEPGILENIKLIGSSNIEMGKKWYENIIFSFIYAIISMKVIY